LKEAISQGSIVHQDNLTRAEADDFTVGNPPVVLFDYRHTFVTDGVYGEMIEFSEWIKQPLAINLGNVSGVVLIRQSPVAMP
jgi:hypothetical protein